MTIYIVLTNKDKNIFKFGRTGNIKATLRRYANGSDIHPDIKFILLVEDKEFVENCVKDLIKKYRYKPRQEIYKIDIETIKDKIFDCASISLKNQEKFKNKNIDSYIIFDDSQIIENKNTNLKKTSKKTSKKTTKKTTKKTIKKTIKKIN